MATFGKHIPMGKKEIKIQNFSDYAGFLSLQCLIQQEYKYLSKSRNYEPKLLMSNIFNYNIKTKIS